MATSPVLPKERIKLLDIIRGFSIIGVLLAYVFWNLGNAPETAYTIFDVLLDKAAVFLVSEKAYTP